MFKAIWYQLGFSDDQDLKGPLHSLQASIYTPDKLRKQLVGGLVRSLTNVSVKERTNLKTESSLERTAVK